jgi:hypothetical protein
VGGSAGGAAAPGTASSGSTKKSKQAASLFDIIKSEMLQLKLDQGKSSKKVDALARKQGELEELLQQLLLQTQHLQQTLADTSGAIEAAVKQQVRQLVDVDLLVNAAAAGAAAAGGGGAGGGAQNVVLPQQPQQPVCPQVPPLQVTRSHPWGVVLLLYTTMAAGLGVVMWPKGAIYLGMLRLPLGVVSMLHGVLGALLSTGVVLLPPQYMPWPGPPLLPLLPSSSAAVPLNGTSAWS